MLRPPLWRQRGLRHLLAFVDTVIAASEVAKHQRCDCAAVLLELNSTYVVGEEGIDERGTRVPINHMGFFNPLANAFLSEISSRDQRSAKYWDYLK